MKSRAQETLIFDDPKSPKLEKAPVELLEELQRLRSSASYGSGRWLQALASVPSERSGCVFHARTLVWRMKEMKWCSSWWCGRKHEHGMFRSVTFMKFHKTQLNVQKKHSTHKDVDTTVLRAHRRSPGGPLCPVSRSFTLSASATRQMF